jgi:hypothetical protein
MFCFTFNHSASPLLARVGPFLGDVALVRHLLPRLQTVAREAVHGEHPFAAGDGVLPPGAAMTERARPIRSRRVLAVEVERVGLEGRGHRCTAEPRK